MEMYRTKQTAYIGKYALKELSSGKLIHGGGVTAPRPRLYETEQAARAGACNLSWTKTVVVRLV